MAPVVVAARVEIVVELTLVTVCVRPPRKVLQFRRVSIQQLFSPFIKHGVQLGEFVTFCFYSILL